MLFMSSSITHFLVKKKKKGDLASFSILEPQESHMVGRRGASLGVVFCFEMLDRRR
jgi:hypothetical protein